MGFYEMMIWWRRRELNPGPKTLPSCLYMRSSGIRSRIRFSPGTGISDASLKDLTSRAPGIHG